MLVDLGYQPHEWQLELHRNVKRFTVCVAHRRFGKTVGSVAMLIHAALACDKVRPHFGYLCPFLRQAKGVSWDYLKQFSVPIPGVKINEGELWIEYPNGGRVRLFGADNADSLRGHYFDGIVIDEVADIKPDVWETVLRPALSDRPGWALFIGTPKGINLFHKLYHYALEGKDQEWAAMSFPVSRTSIIPDAELASTRATMSDAQYRQEYLCDFTAATDNTLITIDVVMKCNAKVTFESELFGMPKVMGVDVARFGDDRSVIFKRWGLCAFEPQTFRGLDNVEFAGRVAKEITTWHPDAVFIDAGRGEGVIDQLRHRGYAVIEVNAGSRPLDQHYADKRAEMWDEMAKWLRSGASLPDNLALKEELCVPTYKFDANGRMRVEAKDEVKKRLQHSPDLADALALTFASPVAAAQSPFSVWPKQQQTADYDPFAAYHLNHPRY